MKLWGKTLLALTLALTLASQGAPAAAAQNEPGEPGAAAQQFTAMPAARRIALTGFTRARARMKIISEASGRCLEATADVGGTIGQNGVFARLDDTFVRLELEANRVDQSRLKSRLAYIRKEAERSRSLVRKKSQAQSELDRLEQEFDQAHHQLRALITQEKILVERRARFAITAPAGWQVILRQVEPGQWVGQGGVVGMVGDFNTLLVPLALSPEELGALKKLGDSIELWSPDLKKKLPAVVERVSPAFDPATRKINLDLAVVGAALGVRGWARVELILDLPDPAGAVLVPEKALVQRYQEYWLNRAQGGKVQVLLMGPGPGGTKRVVSPQVKPGQSFLIP